MGYDFSGYATRNNIRCSDGRTILKDAFADQDGQKVPLVYQHNHSDIDNVLGHAVLENREDGCLLLWHVQQHADGSRRQGARQTR